MAIRVIDIFEIHLRFNCNFSKKLTYDMALEIIVLHVNIIKKNSEFKLNSYLKFNQNILLLIKILIYLNILNIDPIQWEEYIVPFIINTLKLTLLLILCSV